MTKVHPVQIACAFRAAQFYLVKPDQWAEYYRGKCMSHAYICHAIRAAADSGRISKATQAAAISVILERIAPHTALDSWVEANGLIHNASCRDYFRTMQEYRHRWLEALAKEHFAMGENISDQLRSVL